MNKAEFTAALRAKLQRLPQSEVEDRLAFYLELIDDRMEEGLGEEEAVAACGTPDDIATQILTDTPILKLVVDKVKPKRKLEGWEIALIIIGSPIWISLLVALASVVLSLYVVLWSAVIALWAVELSLWGSALGCTLAGLALLFTGKLPGGMLLISGALLCLGASIFLYFGCKIVARGTLKLTKYLHLMMKKALTRKEDV